MSPPPVREAKKAQINDHDLKDRLAFERDRQRMRKRTDRGKGRKNWRCHCSWCRPSDTLRKGGSNLRWLTSADKWMVFNDALDDLRPTDTEESIVEGEMFSRRVSLLDIAGPARPTKLKGPAKDFVMIPSLPRVLDWKDSEVMPVIADDWEML